MDRMIEYCLHNANPSIVYRIRKDILQDISKEEENRRQEKIMSEKIIISILDCQKENGWLGNGFHGSNKDAGNYENQEIRPDPRVAGGHCSQLYRRSRRLWNSERNCRIP